MYPDGLFIACVACGRVLDFFDAQPAVAPIADGRAGQALAGCGQNVRHTGCDDLPRLAGVELLTVKRRLRPGAANFRWQISAACLLSGLPLLLKWRRPSGVVKAQNQLGLPGCL